MWNGFHTHVWQLKIGRHISAPEVPPEEQGIPPPHQAHQPSVLRPERGVSITSESKNQWGLWLSEIEGF